MTKLALPTAHSPAKVVFKVILTSQNPRIVNLNKQLIKIVQINTNLDKLNSKLLLLYSL